MCCYAARWTSVLGIQSFRPGKSCAPLCCRVNPLRAQTRTCVNHRCSGFACVNLIARAHIFYVSYGLFHCSYDAVAVLSVLSSRIVFVLQLGDGSLAHRRTPPVTDTVLGVAALSTGGLHTCVVRVTGGVRCWGFNAYGQASVMRYSLAFELFGMC